MIIFLVVVLPHKGSFLNYEVLQKYFVYKKVTLVIVTAVDRDKLRLTVVWGGGQFLTLFSGVDNYNHNILNGNKIQCLHEDISTQSM